MANLSEAEDLGLIKYGIHGDVTKPDITDHEPDAISAIVVELYLEGEAITIGNKQEGLMVIPKPTQKRTFIQFKPCFSQEDEF